MFDIEIGIEIPKARNRSAYPFDSMAVGDSFFAPGVVTQDLSPAISARSKKYNEKFTRRTVEGGVRVWRIV